MPIKSHVLIYGPLKGVFEDWPENSHLKPNALLYSEAAATSYEPQDRFNLDDYTYVMHDRATGQKDLEDKLEQLTTVHLKSGLEGSGIDVKFQSQPLTGLYFELALIDDVPKENPKYVSALGIAGLLILLSAGLNYINLSLTQSTKRSKEIRLKKLLGISRKQLLLQSAMDSWIMTSLALMISGILIVALDNLYFQYSGFHSLDIVANWPLLIIILFVIFLFGLLGTSYPGVYLSFSGTLINMDKASINAFKKVLLGFQFTVASVIIIATITMHRQIDFMKKRIWVLQKNRFWLLAFREMRNIKIS